MEPEYTEKNYFECAQNDDAKNAVYEEEKHRWETARYNERLDDIARYSD